MKKEVKNVKAKALQWCGKEGDVFPFHKSFEWQLKKLPPDITAVMYTEKLPLNPRGFIGVRSMEKAD